MKKMKRISAVLLLAAGFALAFGGCSNTKDETGTEQGGEAGSGDETGGTGDSNNDSENPDDPNAPKTKFTNSDWKATPSAAYGNLIIALDDLDIDYSKYDFIKVNAKFLDADGKEILYTNNIATGQVLVENGKQYGADDYKSLSVTNMNSISSDFSSAYIPIKSLGFEPKKINVQNAGENVKSYAVNYIEFVKIPGLKKATEKKAASITSAGTSGDTVVFVVSYGKELSTSWGIGGMQDSSWTNFDPNVGEFHPTSTTSAGSIDEFSFDFDKIKKSFEDGFVNFNFYNGAELQYVYIK